MLKVKISCDKQLNRLSKSLLKVNFKFVLE